MEKVKIGIIGAGWWATEYHIPDLKKRNDGMPILIYKKHIVASGLVETYGENINESIKKRDKIAIESFKYMIEKTKGLTF